MHKQKNIFLQSEGDSWFIRNKEKIATRNSYPELQFIVTYLVENSKNTTPENFKFLEIGCGGGDRSNFIHEMTKGVGIGIDPSARAIDFANSNFRNPNLTFLVGTADKLPLPPESLDLVYFSFCLYLVDRDLIQECIKESIRVIRPNGKILILDFDPYEPYSTPYHHEPKITSFKDNYEKYFLEKGFQIIVKLSQRESGEIGFEKDSHKRVATFLLSR